MPAASIYRPHHKLCSFYKQKASLNPIATQTPQPRQGMETHTAILKILYLTAEQKKGGLGAI